MLHDDLADGDRHLREGPGLRRVYTIDRATQSLSVASTASHQHHDAGRRIDLEAADRQNDHYLRGLGWGD
jgi:hypothetical protein